MIRTISVIVPQAKPPVQKPAIPPEREFPRMTVMDVGEDGVPLTAARAEPVQENFAPQPARGGYHPYLSTGGVLVRPGAIMDISI